MTDRMLHQIAADLRAGRTSARKLYDAAEAAWTGREPALHAYKCWNGDDAKASADLADRLFAHGTDLGPLQGIPVSIKDLYGVRGLPTFAGSARRLPEKWEHEGPLVRSLRSQLATITGKTHTVEFAIGGTGANLHWGMPRNPWDAETHRSPGGSSAGAGVSLWQGSAQLAFGSDTAASVRLPASYTGTVGLKTTKGRWSTEGIVPLSTTYDTAGILTRSAEDLAYAYGALDLETSADPMGFVRLARAARVDGLRIGVCANLFEECDPGIADAVMGALRELERAGAILVDYRFATEAEIAQLQRMGGVSPVELAEFLETELPGWYDLLDPEIRARVAPGREATAIEYRAKLRAAESARLNAADAFDAVDLIAWPTAAISPPTKEDALDPAKSGEITRRMLRNLNRVNLLGWCAISIPAGFDSLRLPAGLQLVAPGGADSRLVLASVGVERVLGTASQRLGTPPLLR